jgi:hypothetical protein
MKLNDLYKINLIIIEIIKNYFERNNFHNNILINNIKSFNKIK